VDATAWRLCRRQDCLQPHPFGGGFPVTWLEDTSLRDFDDSVTIQATCLRCLHGWLQSLVQLLIKVDHRDVHLDEVAKTLARLKMGCRHVRARLTLIKNEDTSGFVGGNALVEGDTRQILCAWYEIRCSRCLSCLLRLLPDREFQIPDAPFRARLGQMLLQSARRFLLFEQCHQIPQFAILGFAPLREFNGIEKLIPVRVGRGYVSRQIL
jgi:hypothetical protein